MKTKQTPRLDGDPDQVKDNALLESSPMRKFIFCISQKGIAAIEFVARITILLIR